MRAKISIIVPVYNVEKYLAKCLDSLINQTLKDIKIICVNDGSTDGSADILSDYASRDRRISVITKKNGGLSSARNEGLKKCHTEYVMFCDSDDYYSGKMCEKMLNSIEENDTDLAACMIDVFYLAHNEMEESDRDYYRLEYTGKQFIHDELVLKTDVSVLNKIFRMNILREHKITFPEGLNNEDFYFYNAYMSVSRTISFVNQKLYNYVRRDGSIMSGNFDADKKSIDHLLVANKLFDFYKEIGYLEDHKDLFWKQWVMSFWFSVEHSSSNYKREIFSVGKKFIRQNYEKWRPEERGTRRQVKGVLDGGVLGGLKRKMRVLFVNGYKRFNVRYRQQGFINANLNAVISKNEELMDRLNNLERSIKK